MQTTSSNIDLLDVEPRLVRASSGKRLANYLIDIVFMYVLFFILGVILALISPEMVAGLDSDDPGFSLADRLITLVIYALYMSAMEAIFKGRSLGKFITGTKAVQLDGTPITTSKAFTRGFSRAVPFCVFSALGEPCNPWQDKWTDTLVIDLKKSEGL